MPDGSVYFLLVCFLLEDDDFLSGVVLETVFFPSKLSTFFRKAVSWLESLTHGAGQFLFVTS
ncbi:hypothetical protein CHCC20327_0118 [Bacillus licheniformis]|nr:hypothetical protein CHCC20327_0118 [Bacillus licheniformis]